MKRAPALHVKEGQQSPEGRHRIASLTVSFISYLDLEMIEPVLRVELLKTILLLSYNLAGQRSDLVKLLWSSLAQTSSNVKHISQNLFSISLAWVINSSPYTWSVNIPKYLQF